MRTRRAALLLALCALTGTAVGTAPVWHTRTGALRVVGYNDMAPLLRALARAWSVRHPDAHFAFVLHGTRTAPPALIARRSAFAPMGAAFTAADRAAYRRAFGVVPVRIIVAHDALDPRARSAPLGVFVNAANPLRRITLTVLARILGAAPGVATITRWGQLGLGGAWAVQPLHACGLAPATALGRWMQRHVLDGGVWSAGYTGYAESAQVLARVTRDRDALCFADLNGATPAVRALALVDRRGRLWRGTRAAVVSGGYPLDRALYVYLPPRPVREACAFLSFALTRAGQRIIAVTPPHYLPLDVAQQRTQRAVLAAVCAAPLPLSG